MASKGAAFPNSQKELPAYFKEATPSPANDISGFRDFVEGLLQHSGLRIASQGMTTEMHEYQVPWQDG
jgi:hypothetical protein